MKTEIDQYFPKELSWLAFNERVLQEAADKNNPIVERIRFLGIYSNNLDEFYKVRFADLKRLIYIQLNDDKEKSAEKTKILMEDIQDKVLEMTNKFDVIYQDVVARLARYNIFLISKDEVDTFYY